MEYLIQRCFGVDDKLSYRQTAGLLVVVLGLGELGLNIGVAVRWIINGDKFWAALLIAAIVITNLFNAYKFTNEVIPRFWTFLSCIIGFGSVRILFRYWDQLSEDVHYKKLIDQRFAETLIHSIPAAILQLYVVIFTEDYIALIVGSAIVSLIAFATGLRYWYKFTYDNDNTSQFAPWEFVLELFLLFDFIVRAGGLALFMSIEDFRKDNRLSLYITPIIIFIIEFIFDAIDNIQTSRLSIIQRGFLVGLTSLGSGFMFLLFADKPVVAKIEMVVRYMISSLFFGFFVWKNYVDKNDSTSALVLVVIFPTSLLMGLITGVIMSRARIYINFEDNKYDGL